MLAHSTVKHEFSDPWHTYVKKLKSKIFTQIWVIYVRSLFREQRGYQKSDPGGDHYYVGYFY